MRRHLNVFVNADNVRDLDGVDTRLAPGDVVTDACRRSREGDHGGPGRSHHRHEEGRVRRRGREAAAAVSTLRGPFGPGVPVYATLIDTRGTPRVYASSCNPFFGMKVLRSTDLGKTFNETKAAPAFPKEDGRALANIWSLEAGDGKKELWCGVEPSALFRSRDGGDSWEMVPGISNHEHARKWQPGAGGLCLHTIIRDGRASTSESRPAATI